MKQMHKRTSKGVKRPLEASLLDFEERAVLLAELEPAEDGVGEERRQSGVWGSCRHRCYSVCCDIGFISLLATVAVTGVGVLLLWAAVALGLPSWADQLARYIISAGMFGLASGGTNAIAVLMLLYKLPFVVGSGVFYRQHTKIKEVVRLIVLQQLFSSEHLQNYISKKIRQFSSTVQVTESINKALNTPETAQLLNRQLDELFAEPEAQCLEAVGVSREDLEGVVRPAVLSLCAETAPFVLDTVHQSHSNKPKAISVPRFRKEVDLYLTWRLEKLTEQHVGRLMRDLVQLHLGWVVVWGCILGAGSGIITQGVRISLNFNFFLQ